MFSTSQDAGVRVFSGYHQPNTPGKRNDGTVKMDTSINWNLTRYEAI